MNIFNLNGVRYFILLFFILFSACKQDKKENESLLNTVDEIINYKDSITISIDIPSMSFVALNFRSRDELYGMPIVFQNASSKDSIIVKSFPRTLENELISYSGIRKEKGRYNLFYRYFLTLNGTAKLEMKCVGNDLEVLKSENVMVVDELFEPYLSLSIEYRKRMLSKEFAKNRLDSIYKVNQSIGNLENKKLFNEINYLNYLASLQYVYPHTSEIKDYLSKTYPLPCGDVGTLLYEYIEHNISSIDFKKSNSFTQPYINNLSKGLFLFLKFEDNKGRTEFDQAREWFKTTDYYKRDSTYIKEAIMGLDKKLFKDKVKKVKLESLQGKAVSLADIIKRYPNDYYLLDFWATWCNPCVKGIRTIKKMKIPKNVAVVNFSVDKFKEKEKWKQTSKQLNIDISCLFKETKDNKEFLKFIELQSIPRYVLIDKDMNLLYQAFYRPEEIQFLHRLKDLE